MKRYFEGYYFKHQSVGHTLAIIPGVSNDNAFIQIVTKNKAYNVTYPCSEYRRNEQVCVGRSVFSRTGICLDIDGAELRLTGEIFYSDLTPIKGDIMGPFRFFPMQCRHGVISMRHQINGTVQLNNETIVFNNDLGYIESDSGRSFPKGYAWIQGNDSERDCSVMISAAHIPFAGAYFWGCICVVWLEGREYRLATYSGAKILRCEKGVLILSQGKYSIEAYTDASAGHALLAPQAGSMKRTIYENLSCPTYFRFRINGDVMYEGTNDQTSCEFALDNT